MFILSIFHFSCKTETEKKIIGTWAIDHVFSTSENAEVFFRANMITFKSKQLCTLPRFDKSQNAEGSWHIDKNETGILHIEAVINSCLRSIYTELF